jgi:uracil-DNA glycosylase
MSVHLSKTQFDKSTIIDLFKQFNNVKNEINTLLIEIEQIFNSDQTYLVNFLKTYNIHPEFYKLFIKLGPTFVKLNKHINTLRKTITIFPPENLVYRVFESDPRNIRIVLLGQNPYIKKSQAVGLSFSVVSPTKIPPSLWNIFTEIRTEFPERKYNFTNGDLTKWTSEIFLLNVSLTVIEGKSNSHEELWKSFSEKTIKYLSDKYSNIVFLLLGRNAQDKHPFINKTKHHLIFGTHPSPLSAYSGFFGSGIFKKVEEKIGGPFDWQN